MRVFPEIPKWILVYSPDRAKLSDDFLPFFKTAKTRMRMNKMLAFFIFYSHLGFL
jgi:predicted nicotinamide N-methyase